MVEGAIRRLLTPALVSLLLLVSGAASAAGTKHKTVRFTATSVANSIAPGGLATLLAGDVKGSLGQGAVVIRSKLASSTTATATFTLFTLRGALKGTAHYKFSTSGPVGSGGETLLKGTGAVTSGTGAYKDAKGTFSVSAISPPGQNYYQLTLKGSLTLPSTR